jgi:four helix bundle protein
MFDFERFPVYLKSEEVYSKLLQSVLNEKSLNPRIKDQLRRASSSIVLNIAEGAGKYSKRDKKNYYLTARASAQECVAALRLIKIERHISEKDYDEFYDDFVEIAKMLSGLINTMLKNC